MGGYSVGIRGPDGEYVCNGRRSLTRTMRRTDRQDVRWGAAIVESTRINGKPRQRHIAWVASITESQIGIVHQRRYFWDEVYDRLDRLENRLSIEERRRIESAIALKVPRLSREEHDASVAHCIADFPDVEHRPYREPT
jgi:hypothetical protein